MIAVIRVNLRRAVGDRRLLIIGTLVPVVIILITGLLEGSPREPIGLLHPSARLLHLAETTDGVKVRVEANRTDLTDDILRGRVVAGIIERPSTGTDVRADFLIESATTDAVQARTDVVALLDLMAAEGTDARFTDATLRATPAEMPLSPFAYVAPANLVLFMGIAVLVLSAGLVETRRLGVIQRLSAAPVTKRSIVFGQMASMMVTAVAIALGLLFVGIVLFDVHWGNPVSVLLVVTLLGVSVAALAVIIGTWSRSQEQAIATAVIVAIIAGMLGGCVYQLSTVSTTVREVGHVVPQAWAMDTFVKLIYDHASLTDTLPQIGALAVFAAVLSALAVWYYARKVFSTT
ncbi:MAG TPA: ABC transporter permease [Acidimicrobiales bacterium]|nr:ABC transporter permease [Acidimicrobiales bacterium]